MQQQHYFRKYAKHCNDRSRYQNKTVQNDESMETLNGGGQALNTQSSDARLINMTHIHPYEVRVNTRGTDESSV